MMLRQAICLALVVCALAAPAQAKQTVSNPLHDLQKPMPTPKGPSSPDVPGLLINTKTGPVQGFDFPPGEARNFLGIPFAAPPTGANRFKSPQPVTPWNTTRTAYKFGPACAQKRTSYVKFEAIEEDCLYLNVYAPMPSANATAWPVMIFFYGGSWTYGSSSFPFYYGNFDVTRLKDVIIVTANYRLDMFGWFASAALQAESTDHSTGNMGLKDQRESMRWVQDNIAAFGGDPNRVTIFGQSAGAASTGTHLLAPESKGLFHRAIIESGPYAPWNSFSLSEAEGHYNAVAAAVGCNKTDPTATLSCLRFDVNMTDLLDHQEKNHTVDYLVDWSPVVDGVELTDTQQNLARAGKFASVVPTMIGTNHDEATTFIGNIPHDINATGYTDYLQTRYGATLAPYVQKLYPSANYKTPWWAVSAVWTDSLMKCPARRSARYISEASNGTNPVYYYFFDYEPLIARLGAYLGVFHGAELPFVFDDAWFLIGKEEQDLGHKVSQYWTTFAANGDPNAPGQVNWPTYNGTTDMNMYLDMNIRSGTGLQKTACDFWDSVWAIGCEMYPCPCDCPQYKPSDFEAAVGKNFGARIEQQRRESEKMSRMGKQDIRVVPRKK